MPEERSHKSDPEIDSGQSVHSRTQGAFVFVISLILLFIVASLSVLFASGVLRFGLEGPFIFVLYLLAGLLVAFACFGLLSSTGELSGSPYGIQTRLGGAIVGLVVVVGGGGLYEYFVRGTGEFQLRVSFYENDIRDRTPVEGSFALEYGADIPSRDIHQGTVLFQNIPERFKGARVIYNLTSRDYKIHSKEDQTRISLLPDTAVKIQVEKKPLFVSAEKAKLSLDFSHASVDQMVTGEFVISLSMNAINESERRLPIGPDAELVVYRNNTIPVDMIKMRVLAGAFSDVLVLQPFEPRIVVVDAMVGENFKNLLDHGFEGVVTLFYYSPKVQNTREFHTDFIPMSREVLELPE